MPKRFSELQKKELVKSFTNGATVKELSDTFNFSSITIIRNLKAMIGESEYKKLAKNNLNNGNLLNKNKEKISLTGNKQDTQTSKNIKETTNSDNLFVEIAPLEEEFSNANQKDFASVPIADIDFPKIVYMIVDKNTELEIKLLKDYPNWKFLAENELNRKTIEIFLDLKIAKRFCSKEHKVIKVPNPNVFKTASKILLARGITRIVNSDTLIAI